MLDIPDLDFSDPEAVVNDEAAMGQASPTTACPCLSVIGRMVRPSAS